ncbi:hypothetical protein SASPL_145902 [Salvia splendens]|uniref:Viridiflorene synthase n=1 Tax=Salvia splendens TaxID=180675 RepID=A0A8X8Z825_SALSN|nr:hypothetical protein SASPL_145902 [Salvia splendens]
MALTLLDPSSPLVGGDHFINHISDFKVLEKYSKTIEVLKNDVRSLLTAPETKMIDTMNLINKLERLGGKFKERLKSDAKGMLSLYEASYLRTRGETILDEALAFTTATLKSMWPTLGSPLKKQVERALCSPCTGGFLDLKHEMRHKKELQQVSRWWKELGVQYEPQYSCARVVLAKSIAIASVIDDTYDAYGTIEELEVFTEAIQRWDFGELSRLPEYMRPLYKAILEPYIQFEEELAKEGRSYASYYAIEGLKELVRYYFEEAKWFLEGNLPSFEEYLKPGLITSTFGYLVPSSFMGIGSARKEDFEWLSKKPKIFVAALTIGRLLDDIGSYEFEMERGQLAIGVESYMKENGVTKEEVMTKFIELSTNAWIESNEEMLRPSCYKSWDLLTRIFNFDRVTDVTYKNNEDGYTQPKGLKPHIIALLVDAFEA